MQDKQLTYFYSNITNIVQKADEWSIPTYTAFLDESQQTLVQNHLKNIHHSNFKLYGGYSDATRAILCVYPAYESVEECALEDDCPIEKLVITSKAPLTHSGCLGSIMGLNIKRECVGDIIVMQNQAVVMVTSEMVDFVKSNLFKVGRNEVKVEVDNDILIDYVQDFEVITGTIASMRLDCIVAFLINKSRTIATDYIKQSKVKIDGILSLQPDYKVKPNEKIVITGKGKFLLEPRNKTKKDRIFIEVKRYK